MGRAFDNASNESDRSKGGASSKLSPVAGKSKEEEEGELTQRLSCWSNHVYRACLIREIIFMKHDMDLCETTELKISIWALEV